VSYVAAEHAAEALGRDRLEMMRALPGLAIGAIAGRDSVAAIVAAVRAEGFNAVLPTSVATGTEYGDTSAPLAGVHTLRDILADECEVLDPVRIGSPELWAALNGRYAAEIAARWSVCSPCLACHLYVHLARVPLSWALGGAPVVTGERDTHDGRIKLSQTTESIDAETRVLAYAGVDLLTPLRTASGVEVAALVPGWREGELQLSCVHSGNYKRLDGSVDFDTEGYRRYLAEFFEPAGRAVVDAWRASGLEARDATGANIPAYGTIVEGLLS
jgi:hypothetical protein